MDRFCSPPVTPAAPTAEGADDVEVDDVDVDDVEGMRSTIGRPITSPAPHPRTFRIALATNKKVPCLLRRPQKSVNSAGAPSCCPWWRGGSSSEEGLGEGEGHDEGMCRET